MIYFSKSLLFYHICRKLCTLSSEIFLKFRRPAPPYWLSPRLRTPPSRLYFLLRHLPPRLCLLLRTPSPCLYPLLRTPLPRPCLLLRHPPPCLYPLLRAFPAAAPPGGFPTPPVLSPPGIFRFQGRPYAHRILCPSRQALIPRLNHLFPRMLLLLRDAFLFWSAFLPWAAFSL